MAVQVVSTLPTFLPSVLQGCQFLGYVCAVSAALSPGGQVGGNQLYDTSGQAFGEAIGGGQPLNITSTATGTNASTPQNFNSRKGINLFLNIISIAATCTVRLNYQAQDPNNAANFVTVITVSLDGSSLGTGSPIGEFLLQVYAGAVAPSSGGGTNLFVAGVHPGFFGRVQVSITATASGGGANINYQVNAAILN